MGAYTRKGYGYTMKKRIMTALTCLLLVVVLCTGCGLGSFQDHPGAVDGTGAASLTTEDGSFDQTSPDMEPVGSSSGGEDTTEPPAGGGQPYTVSLLYQNQPFDPGDHIVEVVWHGENSDTVAAVDGNGQASAGVLDGDFDVYLSGLPEAYSYNPNIYRATGDDRHVDIILTSVTQPVRGSGDGLYQSQGCYVLNYQGTYRVTCKAGQFKYFEYQPTVAGRYTVETWVNVYDDEINPVMEIYNGNVAFKQWSETRDTGGVALSGGFTKNVKYEIAMENVGPCYTFGISAYAKSELADDAYITVDFSITYDGPCESGSKYTEVIDAVEANVISKTKDTDETFHYADMGTKLFDGRCYRYDGDSALWRVYDEERYADNDGWGPYLCVILDGSIPGYSITSLYEANHVQGSWNNYLTLRAWDEERQSYVTHDYENFIRVSYKAKCNSNGVCYVTNEMKEFLQLYAKNYNLWTDGVSPGEGTPEEYGYSATEEDMWLFACGFYEDGR